MTKNPANMNDAGRNASNATLRVVPGALASGRQMYPEAAFDAPLPGITKRFLIGVPKETALGEKRVATVPSPSSLSWASPSRSKAAPAMPRTSPTTPTALRVRRSCRRPPNSGRSRTSSSRSARRARRKSDKSPAPRGGVDFHRTMPANVQEVHHEDSSRLRYITSDSECFRYNARFT
jgi:hypothetical protein